MSLRAVSQVRQAAVPRGSRSHLAAKNILISLGQVFGDAGFSSRHASFRLGLDFLYTSKVLSRMAKRPYYYLSVLRIPRSYGGFENFYVISSRGWSKINYYRTHAPLPAKQAGKTLWNSVCNATSLLSGKGLPSEGVASYLSKRLGRDLEMPAMTDDFGQVLITIDGGRAPEEMMLAVMRHWPEGEMLETIDRGMYLQKIGLIPESVTNIPFYVENNKARGISDSTILTTLIIRGAIELREEVLTLKAKLAPIEAKQIETSKRDESLLVGEKKCNERFGKENASLRKELSDVRFEHFRSRLRNGNLCNYIVNLSRLLFTISEDLNKIEISSFDAMAVKAAVHRWLVVIAAMNALTHNSNKPDA